MSASLRPRDHSIGALAWQPNAGRGPSMAPSTCLVRERSAQPHFRSIRRRSIGLQPMVVRPPPGVFPDVLPPQSCPGFDRGGTTANWG